MNDFATKVVKMGCQILVFTGITLMMCGFISYVVHTVLDF